MIFTFQGKLLFTSNGEESDILSIDDEYILTEDIEEKIKKYGNFLTVRYWISDQRKTLEELTEATVMMICGAGQADYGVAYSEYTGYLWTDEDLIVGGHNLLEELKNNINKYLYMEITFSKESK